MPKNTWSPGRLRKIPRAENDNRERDVKERDRTRKRLTSISRPLSRIVSINTSGLPIWSYIDFHLFFRIRHKTQLMSSMHEKHVMLSCCPQNETQVEIIKAALEDAKIKTWFKHRDDDGNTEEKWEKLTSGLQTISRSIMLDWILV